MTQKIIKRVHVVALRKKGLTREDYKLRLNAVGVESCKEMTQQQYSEFMRQLARLPDVQLPHK
jgi:hypothetical protein